MPVHKLSDPTSCRTTAAAQAFSTRTAPEADITAPCSLTRRLTVARATRRRTRARSTTWATITRQRRRLCRDARARSTVTCPTSRTSSRRQLELRQEGEPQIVLFCK